MQKYLEQKAQKYAGKIVKLPFVMEVCLTGSVATGKANEKSDIDYLIIVKQKRLYLARLIAVIAVKAWRQYRTDKNIAGKLCLNWWTTSLKKVKSSKFKVKSYSQKLKVNWEKVGEVKVLCERGKENRVEKILSGEFGNALERIARNYQIYRFKKDSRTYAKGSQVRWSDSEIGLHPFKLN